MPTRFAFCKPINYLKSCHCSEYHQPPLDRVSISLLRIATAHHHTKHCQDNKIWAFQYCSGLVTVSLDDGLEEIEAYAFVKCISLQGIFIPNTVKIINCEAFSGCSGLTTVTLREGLEKIGEGTFANCTSIQRIILPNTDKLIQKWALFIARV